MEIQLSRHAQFNMANKTRLPVSLLDNGAPFVTFVACAVLPHLSVFRRLAPQREIFRPRSHVTPHR